MHTHTPRHKRPGVAHVIKPPRIDTLFLCLRANTAVWTHNTICVVFPEETQVAKQEHAVYFTSKRFISKHSTASGSSSGCAQSHRSPVMGFPPKCTLTAAWVKLGWNWGCGQEMFSHIGSWKETTVFRWVLGSLFSNKQASIWHQLVVPNCGIEYNFQLK